MRKTRSQGQGRAERGADQGCAPCPGTPGWEGSPGRALSCCRDAAHGCAVPGWSWTKCNAAPQRGYISLCHPLLGWKLVFRDYLWDWFKCSLQRSRDVRLSREHPAATVAPAGWPLIMKTPCQSQSYGPARITGQEGAVAGD